MLREIKINFSKDGEIHEYISVKTDIEVFDGDGNPLGITGGHAAQIDTKSIDLAADPTLKLTADERVTVTKAIEEGKRGKSIRVLPE
jgi:hypothetical protein